MKSWPSVLVLGLAFVTTGATAEVVERVVAKVGGDIITLSEFTSRQMAAAQVARVTPDNVEEYLRQNNARILQDAIDELLLVQRASDLGLRLRPEYVDEVIAGIKKDNKIESEEDFAARLRAEGLTLADLKRNIERSILRNQVLRKELEPRVTVSDADVRAEYEKREAEFTKPATIHLQEILVAGSSGESLSKARQLVAELRGGAAFADVAKKHSASPTAPSGGDLGEVPVADLSSTLAREAKTLQTGQVSDPFPDAGGHRIIAVAGRKEPVVTLFEEVRQELMRDLTRPKYDAEYEKYMAGLRQAGQPETQILVREVPTEVSVSPQGSILSGTEAAPAAPSSAPAPADPEAEVSTTPQAAPEHVIPPAAPQRPTPSPTPTPQP